MSGPSLFKLDSHRSIHEGVFTEGRDLLDLLLKVLQEKADNYEKHALMAAEALVEHWETRLIAHADSEEEGFYLEKVKQNPDLLEKVTWLKRDHEIFRIIVKEIRELLRDGKITDDIIDRFKAISVLGRIHNEDEETYLFDDHS
ncbi:hemerythrin domain-containing protein [Neobacillus sedimentimangrovi]|uniref:Hemerythrin domain-containing protein n=1 Tax=Neobacillus sedimentimangrovi TaxID=2699460 RepID=A0ABS8QI65_9BACI|nr:hemerythrin domain-containing protein [Neobacillus sedimentimangrovi]MCD4838901.1 hemerythrin domain-containing protein [Neobacillus sedimentimangrovi]